MAPCLIKGFALMESDWVNSPKVYCLNLRMMAWSCRDIILLWRWLLLQDGNDNPVVDYFMFLMLMTILLQYDNGLFNGPYTVTINFSQQRKNATDNRHWQFCDKRDENGSLLQFASPLSSSKSKRGIKEIIILSNGRKTCLMLHLCWL